MTEQERIKFIQSGDSQNEAQEIVNAELRNKIDNLSNLRNVTFSLRQGNLIVQNSLNQSFKIVNGEVIYG